MPPVSTPVGDAVGFHMRTGSHGQNDYDWGQYLNFADKHFGAPKCPMNASAADTSRKARKNELVGEN